ncbi:hypothetical protein GF318_00825 [Candidatus Micrarchaeota archaeon]|nr:hypothetical protein [Candidatus Micrarchaeota archaeon]
MTGRRSAVPTRTGQSAFIVDVRDSEKGGGSGIAFTYSFWHENQEFQFNVHFGSEQVADPEERKGAVGTARDEIVQIIETRTGKELQPFQLKMIENDLSSRMRAPRQERRAPIRG